MQQIIRLGLLYIADLTFICIPLMVKFALIGLGRIGERHATIIKDFPGAELIAVIDKDNSLAKHPILEGRIPFFSSLETYLKEGPLAEVMVIATPNGLHVAHALEALHAGMHVVIEKPMGISKAACEEVIFKSLQARKQVFVVMQNRYSPPSKWMKQVIDEGRIGELAMVQLNCYWNRDNSYYTQSNWKGSIDLDGGTLFTQFSHFIDIMYWLFGDIKNIQATFANFTHKETTAFEDSGVVQFEFEKGGIGTINFSTSVWDKNMESSITVVGSKGSFKVSGQYMNEIAYCHIEDYIMPELPPTNAPNHYGTYSGSAANHAFVIENVVGVLEGKDTITTNALEGMKVVEIIERIYQHRK